MKRRGLAAACLFLAGALAPCAAAETPDARVERGHAFAQRRCAVCHAIGKTGKSPFSKAPAFRTLHTRYPVEQLEESLAEGIKVGHPRMPEFKLRGRAIADLIAYLKTLEH